MIMQYGTWFVAFAFLVTIAIVVAFSLKRMVELDLRLGRGDIALLDSDSHRINEVIRAPMGSRIDATPNSMLTAGVQMVPVMMPNGTIGLMPLSAFIQQQQ
jgi:hypothetical protein